MRKWIHDLYVCMRARTHVLYVCMHARDISLWAPCQRMCLLRCDVDLLMIFAASGTKWTSTQKKLQPGSHTGRKWAPWSSAVWDKYGVFSLMCSRSPSPCTQEFLCLPSLRHLASQRDKRLRAKEQKPHGMAKAWDPGADLGAVAQLLHRFNRCKAWKRSPTKNWKEQPPDFCLRGVSVAKKPWHLRPGSLCTVTVESLSSAAITSRMLAQPRARKACTAERTVVQASLRHLLATQLFCRLIFAASLIHKPDVHNVRQQKISWILEGSKLDPVEKPHATWETVAGHCGQT